MTTALDFTCTVDPDFFDDEDCDYEKSDLRDSCPKHERNWHALTRRYVAEQVNCAVVHDAATDPLPEFTYNFPRKQISTDYISYNPLASCTSWSFDRAGISLLWNNACPSDFERALLLTMPDGGAEMYELSDSQYEMLRHHTRDCSCRDQEFHDGLCSVSCIEAHGMPPKCRACGERHCDDHFENCPDQQDDCDDED